MKTVRDQFVPFVADLLLPSGAVDAPFAFGKGEQREVTRPDKSKLMNAAAKWIREPVNRKTAQSLIWVCLVLITVLLSTLFFTVGKRFTHGIVVPVCGIAVLWGLLLGIAVLFFLPSKTVITVWGCLLGTSLDKAVTGTGIIQSASQAISGAAGVLASPLSLTESLAQQMLWIFLLTFGLICLPAFFRD